MCDDNSSERPFTEEEMSKIREKATIVLASLEKELVEEGESIPFWIDHNQTNGAPSAAAATTTTTPSATTTTEEQAVRFFNKHGFLRVPNFSDETEVSDLLQEMQDVVEKEWDPEKDGDCFGTDDKQNESRGDYFLESAARVHFFTEPQALKEEGKTALKEEYKNKNKINSLNKIGHGLHIRGPESKFQQYTLSPKVLRLVTQLGWKDPVVPQSMYICKQAKVGGVVTSHQDSTFLNTTPKQSCLGLWLALHKSQLHNGCLWVRPKSHLETLRRQYVRNVDHFGPRALQERSNVPLEEKKIEEKDSSADTQTAAPPQFVMQEHDVQALQEIAPWEGKLPQPKDGSSGDVPMYETLFDAGFVPIECNPGDLLVFPGLLDHLSLPNTSNEPRHTFQLHLVEGEQAGVTWSTLNWLQYPPEGERTSFLSLLRKE